MTDRELCESIMVNCGVCPVNGVNRRCDPTCPLFSGDCDAKSMAEKAEQWLADHPENPAEPEPVSKYATRGESSYSLTLRAGRISIYHWHDKDSESVDFGGTVDDFNQFDEGQPEEWFSLAAKMIAKKGEK